VKLGDTHILCSLIVSEQSASVLSTTEPQISVSLSLIKDSSLNIRRDFIEEKEASIKTGIKQKIREVVLNTSKTTAEKLPNL